MATIIIVHGIGQQFEGSNTLHAQLFPALSDGLAHSGKRVASTDVFFAYYGHLFRPEAEMLATEPYLDASDVQEGYERDLLAQWWDRAASSDPQVIAQEEETLSRSPQWAQRALLALNRSRFFSGIAERGFIGDLRQVSSYLDDSSLRRKIQNEVGRSITEDARVMVGHSLGSIVAYESLCANPDWPVKAFVTLGSPLGLRHIIYDRLEPPPRRNGSLMEGCWPGSIATWTNITDSGDVVAVVEDLRPLFGDQIRQVRVHNGAHAHSMIPYLTDPATGAAIAAGLDARRHPR